LRSWLHGSASSCQSRILQCRSVNALGTRRDACRSIFAKQPNSPRKPQHFPDLAPKARLDYLDHAVVLIERERVRPVRPTLKEVRHYLRGAPFANWADRARNFAAAKTLKPKDHKEYLRTLLYPGRFYYTWMTGLMGSNDDAVAFLSQSHPVQLDITLIARALQCRRSAANPDSLFAARTILLSQIDVCAALLAG